MTQTLYSPALAKIPGDGLALDIRNVDKVYKGKVHALRGVDMQIRGGEVFGLLGPNGAGKSTLVKILLTVIRPTRCDGHMLGTPVGTKETLQKVGYLPEHHRFPEYLTGEQVVDFYGSMAGVERGLRKKRTAELLELVGMKDWAKAKVRSYSKGMRQRVGIAQALVNDPSLVVLDEPTDGVDPVGRRDIRNILAELKRQGRTVLLNSHLLSELEMVCDRVAILVQGKVASHGTIDELTTSRRFYEFEIEGAPEQVAALYSAAVPGLARSGAHGAMLTGMLHEGVSASTDGALTLRVHTTQPELVQVVIDRLRNAGAVIRAVRPVRPTLEDLFMEAVLDPTTGEALAPGAAKEGKKKAAKQQAAGGGA